jgi:hypothetical protein
MSPSPVRNVDRESPAPARAGSGRLRLDLRQGRNLDLYVVVGLALVIAVLGVIGAVDSNVLASCTLAVLALMATSALMSRHQVDDLTAALDRVAANESGNVAADRFLTERIPALDGEIATATDIGFVGTLTRTMRDALPVLDRRLRAGARVRILVIDTDSSANAESVARSRKADTPDFYRNHVSSTIDLLRVLATTGSSEASLQVRLLPFVPTFGMCVVDGMDSHGRIYVEMYQHRSLESRPAFSLRADRDGRWYTLFAGQFETMWSSGRPVELQTRTD